MQLLPPNSTEDILQLLKRHKFRPNDLLGQNFLVNDEILEQIVSAAEIKKDEEVLEIGSGIGNLTEKLADKCRYLLAIEKDQRYFPILRERLGDKLMAHTRTPKSSSNVELVFADVTTFNFQELLAPGYKVVANIPYYITGKIVEMLVTAKNKPSRIVLLMQKEVAERIVAKPGEMSILAVSVQLYAQAKIAGLVPKEEFHPQPKVDSAILVLDIREKPLFKVNEKKFFGMVKAAFAGKRKQIHNTLKNNLKVEPKILEKLFAAEIVDPQARPQDLKLETWHKIYQFLEENKA